MEVVTYFYNDSNIIHGSISQNEEVMMSKRNGGRFSILGSIGSKLLNGIITAKRDRYYYGYGFFNSKDLDSYFKFFVKIG
ncbi:MAG: hypothetical protein H6622_05445 [Halobacteriovoraceae bacterium]|nr:hypothetical protein [Halobacteriovoraceae bacterium]